MTAAFAVRFDMRRAPFAEVTEAEQYAESVAMARWADARGVAAVTVSEHHGVDFVSAPVAHAAAIVGATTNARVMVNALLITLHDPVRLAEALATLDLTSGGRFTIVAGLGYRHEEFEMAGVDRSTRGRLAEEYLEVLRAAWTGDEFEWRGRRVRVTPTPASPIEQVVWVGGSVRRSAERAARLRLPFFTMSVDPAVGDAYRAACAEHDYDGIFMAPFGPMFVHVAEDPDRAWSEIAPYALYDVQSYASWQTGDQDNPHAIDVATADDLRASGAWLVVTPDECEDLVRRNGSVALHPLMGGMPTAMGWESLELFVDAVLPRL